MDNHHFQVTTTISMLNRKVYTVLEIPNVAQIVCISTNTRLVDWYIYLDKIIVFKKSTEMENSLAILLNKYIVCIMQCTKHLLNNLIMLLY